MDSYVNGKETDYLSTISLLEEVRPVGIAARVGRWFAELEEEFADQRFEYDPLLDFPRDI